MNLINQDTRDFFLKNNQGTIQGFAFYAGISESDADFVIGNLSHFGIVHRFGQNFCLTENGKEMIKLDPHERQVTYGF
jgi:hypothetical protein